MNIATFYHYFIQFDNLMLQNVYIKHISSSSLVIDNLHFITIKLYTTRKGTGYKVNFQLSILKFKTLKIFRN